MAKKKTKKYWKGDRISIYIPQDIDDVTLDFINSHAKVSSKIMEIVKMVAHGELQKPQNNLGNGLENILAQLVTNIGQLGNINNNNPISNNVIQSNSSTSEIVVTKEDEKENISIEKEMENKPSKLEKDYSSSNSNSNNDNKHISYESDGKEDICNKSSDNVDIPIRKKSKALNTKNKNFDLNTGFKSSFQLVGLNELDDIDDDENDFTSKLKR